MKYIGSKQIKFVKLMSPKEEKLPLSRSTMLAKTFSTHKEDDAKKEDFSREELMCSSRQQTSRNTRMPLRTNYWIIVEQIRALQHSEQTNYSRRSYSKQQTAIRHRGGTLQDVSLWRKKISRWMYTIIKHFDLSRRTVAISMDIFDRFLAKSGNHCDGNSALLISLTSLFIAIKVHETNKISLDILSDISRNQFSAKQIGEMELKMLHSLEWLVYPPIPVDIIVLIIRLMPVGRNECIQHHILLKARFLAELSVCDHFFVDVLPSMTAFAAVLNALEEEMRYESLSRTTREIFLMRLDRDFNFHREDSQIKVVQDRLRAILLAESPEQRKSKLSSIMNYRRGNSKVTPAASREKHGK